MPDSLIVSSIYIIFQGVTCLFFCFWYFLNFFLQGVLTFVFLRFEEMDAVFSHHTANRDGKTLSYNGFKAGRNWLAFDETPILSWSIVYTGVSTPPPSKTPLHSLWSCPPPLIYKLSTPSPPFRQFPPLYWLSVNHPPKNWIFQLTPIILKLFIINPISSFKSIYILS